MCRLFATQLSENKYENSTNKIVIIKLGLLQLSHITNLCVALRGGGSGIRFTTDPPLVVEEQGGGEGVVEVGEEADTNELIEDVSDFLVRGGTITDRSEETEGLC